MTQAVVWCTLVRQDYRLVKCLYYCTAEVLHYRRRLGQCKPFCWIHTVSWAVRRRPLWNRCVSMYTSVIKVKVADLYSASS